MAETLATLQAWRTKISAAMASGVLVVKHGDEQITYRSLAEMQRIAADIDAKITNLEGTRRRRIRYPYQSGKGL